MTSHADPSDIVNYLRTSQGIEAYVRGAMLEQDPAYLRKALGHAALAVNRWRVGDLPRWLHPLIRQAAANEEARRRFPN
jgi:hypothetical protein